MCRWAAYIGEPIYLEDVVTAPGHSLITQSLHACESKSETNGDGFGLCWYGEREEPGRYHDVLPAWADCNLRSLAHQVRSGLFLAHVRAATGTGTSRANCHPFSAGKWSFMHNGQAGGYSRFRRKADMSISEHCYPFRNGTTDSEAIFLLALGAGLDENPKAALERATGLVENLSRETGITPHMRMTVAMSDGERLYCARYASDFSRRRSITGAWRRGGLWFRNRWTGRNRTGLPFRQGVSLLSAGMASNLSHFSRNYRAAR